MKNHFKVGQRVKCIEGSYLNPPPIEEGKYYTVFNVSSDGLSVKVNDITRDWWYATRFELVESEENANITSAEFTVEEAIEFVRSIGYRTAAERLEKEFNSRKDPEYKEYIRLHEKFGNKE